MTRKKWKAAAVTAVVLLIAFSLFFIIGSKADKEAVEGDQAIVKVRGWDLEYTVSGRSLSTEDFEAIELGSSLDEIEEKLGKPDGWVGSGILWPFYVLEDNSAVELVFKNEDTCEELYAVFLYQGDEELILKKADD